MKCFLLDLAIRKPMELSEVFQVNDCAGSQKEVGRDLNTM